MVAYMVFRAGSPQNSGKGLSLFAPVGRISVPSSTAAHTVDGRNPFRPTMKP